MYEALVSFATKIISMFKGQVAEIDDPEIVEDLLAAKYIEAYSPQPSGGYDGKIKLTYEDDAITGGILESGTYDSILNALDTKNSANIIVYEQSEDEFGDTIFSYTPNGVYITRSSQEAGILVSFTDASVNPSSVLILPDNTVVA